MIPECRFTVCWADQNSAPHSRCYPNYEEAKLGYDALDNVEYKLLRDGDDCLKSYYMENITFATFPQHDGANAIFFTVPTEWAIEWNKDSCFGYKTFEDFIRGYTFDETEYMYFDAKYDNVIVSEEEV